MNALPFHFGMLFQAIAFKKRKKKKKEHSPNPLNLDTQGSLAFSLAM